jgi:F-type H+-transporting ATPase subunit b
MTIELWFLAVFVTFFALVGKKSWHVLKEKLDKHRLDVETQLRDAKALRVEAEALCQHYKAQREAMLEQSERILTQAKAQAHVITAQALATLEQDIASRTKASQDHIKQQYIQAENLIRQKLIHLAIEQTSSACAQSPQEVRNAYTHEAIQQFIARPLMGSFSLKR